MVLRVGSVAAVEASWRVRIVFFTGCCTAVWTRFELVRDNAVKCACGFELITEIPGIFDGVVAFMIWVVFRDEYRIECGVPKIFDFELSNRVFVQVRCLVF